MQNPARFVAFITMLAFLSIPTAVRAEDEDLSMPPPPPAAFAPGGGYVAPLSQTTQPAYVPQSVALTGPRILQDWEEGNPIPHGYHPEPRRRILLMMSSASSFVSLYCFSVVMGAVITDASKKSKYTYQPLYIPVLGPFLQMSRAKSATATALLAFDGIGQTIGVAVLIAGVYLPKVVLVRNDLGSASISPVLLGRGRAGIGLSAAF